MRDGYGVELWFIYTARRNVNIDKIIDVYNRNPENIDASRSIRHFPYEIMAAAWHEREDQRTRRISDETINIGDGKHFSFSGDFGDAIVASIPGGELARLYDKYGEILFDRNVRLFLGNRKGSVNAGISNTLMDQSQRSKFWSYNNGITVICDRFSVDDRGQNVTVTNFNIINGCQTTISLARTSADLSNVHVLARIINPPADIVDDIN